MERQRILLLRVVCLFWIGTKLFSYKLWLADRLFPLVPAPGLPDTVPNGVHLALFLSALTGMALLVAFPRNRWLPWLTLAVELASCLLDQNRWQPYEYQYFLTLLLFASYRDPRSFVTVFGFLLATIYCYSGLHKCNGAFLYLVWERMILRAFEVPVALRQSGLVHYAGLLLPLLETAAGVALLVLRNKRSAGVLLIAMHLCILLLISPAGLNHNPIVWPWNVLMIYVLHVVFVQGEPVDFRGMLRGVNRIPLVWLGLVPLLSFVGLYDHYLAFNLYSGTPPRMEICIGNPEALPQYRPYFKKGRFCQGRPSLDLTHWSLQELRIAVYPETRVYRKVMEVFEARHPEAEATYVQYRYPFRKENTVRLSP